MYYTFIKEDKSHTKDRSKNTDFLGDFTKQDILNACFMTDRVLKHSNPSAVIVMGDLRALDKLLPAIAKSCQLYPDAKIIISGGKNTLYGSADALAETVMVMKALKKATGLPMTMVLQKTESEIIKDILTGNEQQFQIIRKKFQIFSLPENKVIAIEGNNYHTDMETAKSEIKRAKSDMSSVALIIPKHAKRAFLTLLSSFPDAAASDKISVITYPYTYMGQTLDERFILNTDLQTTTPVKKKAFGFVLEEIDLIQKYGPNGTKHLIYTPEVAKVFGRIYPAKQKMAEDIHTKQND